MDPTTAEKSTVRQETQNPDTISQVRDPNRIDYLLRGLQEERKLETWTPVWERRRLKLEVRKAVLSGEDENAARIHHYRNTRESLEQGQGAAQYGNTPDIRAMKAELFSAEDALQRGAGPIFE